jgi:negative regulator of sigma E activity
MKLDPITADVMKLLELPTLPARKHADLVADHIARCAQDLAIMAEREGDALAAGQLTNTASALMACMINVAAYARGHTPKVASKAPDTNIIVQ